MRKTIAALNMSLDGYCDHTVGIADAEIHQHYADLLRGASAVLFGRITYELMTYWQTVAMQPTGTPATDAFAAIIDQVPKTVFSRTLADTGWATARLAAQALETEVQALRQQPGDYQVVASRSLIVQLLNAELLDEFQLCVHPVVAGGGLPLFDGVDPRTTWQLAGTQTFANGVVCLRYQPGVRSTENG